MCSKPQTDMVPFLGDRQWRGSLFKPKGGLPSQKKGPAQRVWFCLLPMGQHVSLVSRRAPRAPGLKHTTGADPHRPAGEAEGAAGAAAGSRDREG